MKELEMILAAVAQLGESGKEAFIWWLVMDKGLGFLSHVVTLTAFALCVRWTLPLFGNDGHMRAMRDAMGVGLSGPVTADEIRQMYQWVQQRKGE